MSLCSEFPPARLQLSKTLLHLRILGQWVLSSILDWLLVTLVLNMQMAISSVDVMCSFAVFSLVSSGPSCRPSLVPKSSNGAVMELKGLWHPCAVAIAGGSVVPNDLTLGTRQGCYLLKMQKEITLFLAVKCCRSPRFRHGTSSGHLFMAYWPYTLHLSLTSIGCECLLRSSPGTNRWTPHTYT